MQPFYSLPSTQLNNTPPQEATILLTTQLNNTPPQEAIMFTLVAVIVMFAITIEAASIEKREVDADEVEMTFTVPGQPVQNLHITPLSTEQVLEDWHV